MAGNEASQDIGASLATTLKKMDPSMLEMVLTNKRPNETSSHEEIKKRSKTEEPINQYKGWQVPSSKYKIPTIAADSLKPEEFYAEYVSKRRPVVLKGNLQDLVGLNKWKASNDRLKQAAGSFEVQVEVRSDTKEAFGQGNKMTMELKRFLDMVEQGDEMHYLTTQEAEMDSDGRPALMAPFMQTLKDDFPLRPKLMGNLIPHNINLWMGNTIEGSSSGLHHDYHDNLYIMIRGTKKFRLFSPMDADKMYTTGVITKVHPNGRINYEGEATTADGVNLQEEASAKAAKAKETAEQRLIDAEKAVEEGKPGAEEELEKAEEMLEQAMDDLIDAQMDGDGDGDDDNLFDGEDDEDGEDDLDDLDSEDNEDDEGDEHKDVGGFMMGSKEERNCSGDSDAPLNFSKIDAANLDDDENALKKKFPKYVDAKSAHCELSEGEMLFLPASWFHEVTSVGGENGHMAFNYWFHPSDTPDDFQEPYSSGSLRES